MSPGCRAAPFDVAWWQRGTTNVRMVWPTKTGYLDSTMHCFQLGTYNSLPPGRCERNFTHVIFKLMLVNDGWGFSYEIALIWMSQNFTYDQSTLVQVMAWCHQATSHYLNQCWPRSLSPYGVTRPQWVIIDSEKGAMGTLRCWFRRTYWFKTSKYLQCNFDPLC